MAEHLQEVETNYSQQLKDQEDCYSQQLKDQKLEYESQLRKIQSDMVTMQLFRLVANFNESLYFGVIYTLTDLLFCCVWLL